MPKKLQITIGSSVFEATLLEKPAPVTCATLLKHLPYEGEGVHSAWSGQSVYVLWQTGESYPTENRTTYGTPGDVVWYGPPDDIPMHEIFISYGVSQYRAPDGPLRANLFARITEKQEQLESVCSEMQKKGTKRITLRQL